MNRKELYQEIGNIDDDLVQEASSAYGKKYNLLSLCRIAGIAACLCLICSGILSVMRRDVIYFNETAVPIVSKIIVPTGENIQVVPMGCQDILDYYGIKKYGTTPVPALWKQYILEWNGYQKMKSC